ncbi:MAG TPA: hypothetical protein VM431_03875 [Phycisphaerae bacterium]|nr:hypothetical protein [Phycisphaerae bacterium]
MTAPAKRRSCTLRAGIRVERGTRADWLALAPLHYRSHHAGAITDVFRMVYDVSPVVLPRGGARPAVAHPTTPVARRPSQAAAVGPDACSWQPRKAARREGMAERRSGAGRLGRVLVGVIVYSRAALSLAARDRATGGRYRASGMTGMAEAHLVNRELRVISRVVIAPNWRGLGLAGHLVAETLPQVGTPYVEALAAMGRVHPFFEQAGMTAYRRPPSRESERLKAALEAVGIGRSDRRSAAALGLALDALAPAAQHLALAEIGRWARSYLGAKNHRVNRPGRQRMLDLVARHLDSEPVYYLWRREPTP